MEESHAFLVQKFMILGKPQTYLNYSFCCLHGFKEFINTNKV